MVGEGLRDCDEGQAFIGGAVRNFGPSEAGEGRRMLCMIV